MDRLNPTREQESLEFRFRVISDGRVLDNGTTLFSGDPFYVEIEPDRHAYLYVVLLDSSENVSRL